MISNSLSNGVEESMENAGTFVGAKLTEDCADRLYEWMIRQGIPNPTPKEELHCTVVYSESRDLRIDPLEYEPPLEIDPVRFRFKHFGDNREVLVLAFDRDELAYRHKLLREKYKLDWKFPSYIPHVTLSYNAPDHLDVLPDFPLEFRGEEIGGFSPPDGSAASEHVNEKVYEIINDEPVKKVDHPAPPKTLIKKNLKKLGLAEELHYTQSMVRNARGNKCQMIVHMPAMDFLKLTVNQDDHIDTIFKANAKPVDRYNHWARMGDEPDYHAEVNKGKDRGSEDYEYGSDVHPFLRIDLQADSRVGKVRGHEGRHRAAATLNAGGKTVQVALCFRPGKGMFPKRYSPEYEVLPEHMPIMIQNQYQQGVFVNTKDWKIIEGDMLQPYRRATRESILREVAGTFGWFNPATKQEVESSGNPMEEHTDIIKRNPEAFGIDSNRVGTIPWVKLHDLAMSNGWVRVNHFKSAWFFQGIDLKTVQKAADYYYDTYSGFYELVVEIGQFNRGQSVTMTDPLEIKKFVKGGVLPA